MLVTLEVDKEQLEELKKLINKLDISLDIVPTLSEEQEDQALYVAMQEGLESGIATEEETKEFVSFVGRT
ncbi:hypothetical protein P0082_07585 [Candidatus Haliotispira prima]|uniref:Uncharacterized protein n=1 Tax=Candidatus Haliotispira prima TaxID=3034016 RepID=A0ABY8MEG3_9SPIO|nr:hypothetical protein P0082_07585 [Candidatus Haliotispira prima]